MVFIQGTANTIQDRGLLQFTHDEWQTAIIPKVNGARNLHEALSGEALDFFILFSSISGIVGQWGQGNYAAANTFLDSFVQYRHAQGQPASVLDIGVMGDVGYVSQNPGVLEQFKQTSISTLREQDLLDALQLAMRNGTSSPPSPAGYLNPAQLVMGLRSTKPLSDPGNRCIWKRDIRMSMYLNRQTAAASTNKGVNEGLKHFLDSVASEPAILDEQSNLDFLTHEIGARLYSFMLRSEEDMDLKQPLSALGVDSLVAMEIRNWWRLNLGIEISVLELLNSGSIEELGKIAVEALRSKFMAQVREKGGDTYLLMKAP